LEHGYTSSYNISLLPDDSETCESDLGKTLKAREIEFFQPKEILPEHYIELFNQIRLYQYTLYI
jgi:hypothetical protein